MTEPLSLHSMEPIPIPTPASLLESKEIGSKGNRVSPQRITFLMAAVIGIFLIFVLRLVYYQVVEGKDALTAAEDNRTELLHPPSSRGVIYDRNGVLLARNVPVYNITITPALLPDETSEVQAIYRRISSLTGVPIKVPGSRPSRECAAGRGIDDLVQEWIGLAPYHAVKVQCNADPQVAMTIQQMESQMPGVGVQITSARDYPTGAYTSQLIGYMGPIPESLSEYYQSLGYTLDTDRIGYSGIEASMQDVLAGTYGDKLSEVDAAGLEIRVLEPPKQPIPGLNIRLTIDTRLQAAATDILQRTIDEMRAARLRDHPETLSPVSTGVVIAMNPRTGEILAMVSLPTYDNAQFSREIPIAYYSLLAKDINNPLLNHAIAGTYPPGSTYKLVTAIGALNEKIVTPDTIVMDKGFISIQEKFYPEDPGRPKKFYCYYRAGHGPMDFINGLAQSCDVYFYNLGGGLQDVKVGLGPEREKLYANALGYGHPLGIELPGEAGGIIPDPTWKRITQGENWATGDTYIATIGQGFVTSTPLQVLESAATIANNGRAMKPTIIKELLDGEGNIIRPFQPTMLWDIAAGDTTPGHPFPPVQPWVIQEVQQGMRAVVLFGTASHYGVLDNNISSAGKTGTAEYCDNIANQRNRCIPDAWPTHGWYTAYAPFDNPEIAVVAFVYDGGEGSVISGPIVKQVMDAYFKLKTFSSNPYGN
jgi:penicillin-binding protein 2